MFRSYLHFEEALYWSLHWNFKSLLHSYQIIGIYTEAKIWVYKPLEVWNHHVKSEDSEQSENSNRNWCLILNTVKWTSAIQNLWVMSKKDYFLFFSKKNNPITNGDNRRVMIEHS